MQGLERELVVLTEQVEKVRDKLVRPIASELAEDRWKDEREGG